MFMNTNLKCLHIILFFCVVGCDKSNSVSKVNADSIPIPTNETSSVSEGKIVPASLDHLRPITKVTETDVNPILPLKQIGLELTPNTNRVDLWEITYACGDGIALQTLVKPGTESLVAEQNHCSVSLPCFPMVMDGFIPRKGRWNFKFDANSKDNDRFAVTLGNGSKLQIIYQDSRLSVGTNANVSHYGLRCTPGEYVKVIDYLSTYQNGSAGNQHSSPAWIGYTPSTDIIPCLINVYRSNQGELDFIPLLNYKVEEQGESK
jgi:hypothetical protein